MLHTFQFSDYSIFLGDLRDTFPAWLLERSYSRTLLITDKNTRHHCLPIFLQKTGLTDDLNTVEIPAGENFKTLATCQQIWHQMLDAQLDRRALVVNLGGGVIGDMGGFCAATWKRGVDFVQIPTTLLAMTDAAIGGKLGIDFQGIKNTVGVFKDPAAVFVDPVFLETLPERELRSGFAEVIKHALIGDPKLWQRIVGGQSPGGLQLSESWWFDLLRASIAVKARVVQEDPLEKGIRALLNFGHTVGHAVESYFLGTDEPLTHGEAVAIGMICESQISRSEQLMEVIEVTRNHFLHRFIPESAFQVIWEWMQQDKKNSSGMVRMAVPGAESFSMEMFELKQGDVERSLAFYNSLSKS